MRGNVVGGIPNLSRNNNTRKAKLNSRDTQLLFPRFLSGYMVAYVCVSVLVFCVCECVWGMGLTETFSQYPKKFVSPSFETFVTPKIFVTPRYIIRGGGYPRNICKPPLHN